MFWIDPDRNGLLAPPAVKLRIYAHFCGSIPSIPEGGLCPARCGNHAGRHRFGTVTLL